MLLYDNMQFLKWTSKGCFVQDPQLPIKDTTPQYFKHSRGHWCRFVRFKKSFHLQQKFRQYLNIKRVFCNSHLNFSIFFLCLMVKKGTNNTLPNKFLELLELSGHFSDAFDGDIFFFKKAIHYFSEKSLSWEVSLRKKLKKIFLEVAIISFLLFFLFFGLLFRRFPFVTP